MDHHFQQEVVPAGMEDLSEFSQPELPLVVLAQGVVDHTRYKSLLQDYMQKRKGPNPVYCTIDAGSTKDVAFMSTVFVDGERFTSENLPQKKLAEQQAAKIALCRLSQKRKDEGCLPVLEATESGQFKALGLLSHMLKIQKIS